MEVSENHGEEIWILQIFRRWQASPVQGGEGPLVTSSVKEIVKVLNLSHNHSIHQTHDNSNHNRNNDNKNNASNNNR